jgi:LCP family protein required for cell wall assembly
MPSYPPAGGAQPALPPHLDPRGRHRGGRPARSGGGRIVLSIMTLVSIALLVLAGYVWYTFRDVNQGVKRIEVKVGVQASNPIKEFNGKDVNILLVGNDDRSNMTNKEVHALHVGRDGGSLATDTMMIVHIPANGKKATLISLPRDSWVSIKGRGMGKLNSAYANAYVNTDGTQDQKRQAGANALLDSVTQLTGLTIDHYIQVDLLGFYRISNAIGGVPVKLCRAVNDTVAYNRSVGSDGGSGLKLSKGKHTLKGVQALEFVRQRHNLPNGDLDRVRRQQYFLTSAFRQVASVGVLFKLRSVGDAITQSVFTDKGLNLLDLGRQLENLTANNINGKTIPTTPGTLDDGTSVLFTNPAKVKRFVTNVINPPTNTPAPSTSKSAATTSKSGSSPSATKSTSAIDAKCIN